MSLSQKKKKKAQEKIQQSQWLEDTNTTLKDWEREHVVIVLDSIFDEDYLQQLDELCKGELLQLDSETGSHVGEYTDYEWQMIKNDIRTSPHRLKLLSEIGEHIGTSLPTKDLEPNATVC